MFVEGSSEVPSRDQLQKAPAIGSIQWFSKSPTAVASAPSLTSCKSNSPGCFESVVLGEIGRGRTEFWKQYDTIA